MAWRLPKKSDAAGWRELAEEFGGFIRGFAAGRCIGLQDGQPCIACKARAWAFELPPDVGGEYIGRTRNEAKCLLSPEPDA